MVNSLLSIYFLNVKHGDSIVIKYDGPDGPVFGVIDSNTSVPKDPPALIKLKELNAQKLSFVALTHPDADHYTGLPLIIEAYKNKIEHFYSFPLNHHLQGRLKKIASIYRKINNSTDSPKIQKDTTEFVKTLVNVKQYIGLDNWFEPNGYYNVLAPPGFEGVRLIALLPPSKVKGPYFQMIEQENYNVGSLAKTNDLSLAFSIQYMNYEIILGGDATHSNWLEHIHFCNRSLIPVNGDVVKLPHHGSKKDCSERVIDHLFCNSPIRFACISANGRSHPHHDTIKIIANKKILPYCTNLSVKCGNNLLEFQKFPELSPVVARFMRSMRSRPSSNVIQTCQGNIEVQIDQDKAIKVIPEYNHPCPLRGDYDFILS